ncbi:MAG: alpha-mannosidase [Promethearchaeota archaeon]
MKEKIGHYSRSRRIDASSFNEPDFDDEKSKEKWFGGKRKVNTGRLLPKWINSISKSINPENLQIHIVGQSHIDIAWMWRYEQTKKKAQKTFKKAILHSNIFPDTYRFALSEPLLLEWIKKDNPDLFKDIQDLVKRGNIELVGGSYVEPDCMMPSGESFIRQRLYGMRFYRENFGILPDVEWFLDSFGYNHGLSQILAKSGAQYFWTSKLTWNRDTVFPFVNFWWQGPDGSKILTANFGMGMGPLETWEKFEVGRHLLKRDGRKIWSYDLDYEILNQHIEKEICPHVGYFFGHGDGGHGPTHREVAFANELTKNPMFKWSKIGEFYKELEKYSEKFPIWNDELYLETHRGCFSNHAEVKRYNRKFENLLVSLEILFTVLTKFLPEFQYPRENLELLWKITLKNQFHDILPGSSIPEVYDDCWDDWNEQKVKFKLILKEVGNILSNDKSVSDKANSVDIYFFNPSSWERNSRIFIPITVFTNNIVLNNDNLPNYAKVKIFDSKNKEYICQPVRAELNNTIDPLPAGWWTIIPLKPLCLTPAKIILFNEKESKKIEKSTTLKASKNVLSNELLSVRINPKNGAIIELIANYVDKGINLLNGESSNLTFGYLDIGYEGFAAWNLTPKYWEYPLDFGNNNKKIKIKVINSGPIFTSLEISKELAINPISQKITLFKDLPLIYLEYNTNWKQSDAMLKILYSTNTKAEIVTSDGVYCAIQQKTNPKVSCDKARFEKICHKYIDLSTPDRKWGIALLNEGKYAFDVDYQDMRLTMLRCCKYPPPSIDAWVNKERKVNKEKYNNVVPSHSGLGPFKCRYALFPHNGGALINPDGTPNVAVKRKAEEFNNPIIILPSKGHRLDLLDPILEIQTPNVYLGALKLKEWVKSDNIIIRFFEGSGISTTARIKINSSLLDKISLIKPVDLLEREIKKSYELKRESGVLTFELNKFEICTFELVLN